MVEAARPRAEEERQSQGTKTVSTPALRALVRAHIGARTCPKSVDRATLMGLALRLRLVAPLDASNADGAEGSASSRDVTKLGKRTRTDRTDKNKRMKFTHLTTVKCALLSRIRCGADPVSVARVVAKIKDRVEAYSRRAVNASLAFSGIVRRLFHMPVDDGVAPTPPHDDDLAWIADVAVPPELFTQTFFRQLLLGTAGAQLPSQTVAQFHQAHPQLLLPGHRHLGDRNIYSAGAIQYLTNLKNALRVELDDRIKIACSRLGLPKDDVKVVLYRIHGWTLPRRFGCCLPQPMAADAAVATHRRVLGLAGLTNIDDTWLADDANLPSLLRYSVYLNKVYQENDAKLFNVVPICGVRAHFIRIDTSVLYGILREAKVVGKTVRSALFDKLRDVFWLDTFDFRKVKPGGSSFGWSVMTDGVSLCTTFEKAAVPIPVGSGGGVSSGPSSADYVPSPNDVVVGNDPGRINIYYMAGVHGGRTKVVKLTRRQYYTESGATAARRTTERWTRGIQAHLDALSTASTKGVSWTAYEWYLIQFGLHGEALWTEYLKPRWARQRLSLYGGKKRVFANFFNRLAAQFSGGGGRLVVAYGNAKFPSGGAGEQSVPTTRAYKECVSRVLTYSTDEFRTSKVHHADDSVLELLATRSQPRRGLRGLLFNPDLGKFVSRDLNAALNIRRILIGPRPIILCRQGVMQRLEQHIVKRLRDR